MLKLILFFLRYMYMSSEIFIILNFTETRDQFSSVLLNIGIHDEIDCTTSEV